MMLDERTEELLGGGTSLPELLVETSAVMVPPTAGPASDMRFWRSPALLGSLLTVVSITAAAAGSDPALTVTAPPSAVVSASTLPALVFTACAAAASGVVILESTCAFKALAW